MDAEPTRDDLLAKSRRNAKIDRGLLIALCAFAVAALGWSAVVEMRRAEQRAAIADAQTEAAEDAAERQADLLNRLDAISERLDGLIGRMEDDMARREADQDRLEEAARLLLDAAEVERDLFGAVEQEADGAERQGGQEAEEPPSPSDGRPSQDARRGQRDPPPRQPQPAPQPEPEPPPEPQQDDADRPGRGSTKRSDKAPDHAGQPGRPDHAGKGKGSK